VPVLTEQPVFTVEQLPRGAGWLLITAGVVGLVVPVVPGAPLLLAGAILLTPGGSRLLEGDGFELSVPRERGHRFELSLLFMSLKPSAL
jgi:hypothetical protein